MRLGNKRIRHQHLIMSTLLCGFWDKQMARIVALLAFVSMPAAAFCADENADTVCTYSLEKRQGHYFFNADFGKARATFMIESGIPALLVDSAFYVQHKKELDLKNMEVDSANIRLHNNLYHIAWSGVEEVSIGAAVYSGKVFVVSGFNKIALPIQNLQSGFSNKKRVPRRLVRMDLGSLRMQVLKDARLSDNNSLNMRINGNTGMPVIGSRLTVSNDSATATMSGDFIIDLGNPMLLFLMKQHPAVSQMIRDNGLKLQEAKTPQGVVVAEGLFAERCTLLGRTFNGVSIGVTSKMRTIKEAGLIGLKFFADPVLFDFDNMKMHIER